MNLKLLFIVNNNEKKLSNFVNKFNLPFNTLLYGEGTASQGILDFLDLEKTRKNILLSIIPDTIEKELIDYFHNETKIREAGKGIAFTVPLSSSSKYLMDTFQERDGKKMKKTSNYHLIITITNDGTADKIMNVAKKNGANGGTLIKGRSLGEKNTLKFFNLVVEPEKDVILIVCKNDDKNKIMNGILEKCGMNTDSRSMCFSLPIDSTVGIDE